jgi:hypothetical protein
MLISISIIAGNSVQDRDQRGIDLRRDIRGRAGSGSPAKIVYAGTPLTTDEQAAAMAPSPIDTRI